MVLLLISWIHGCSSQTFLGNNHLCVSLMKGTQSIYLLYQVISPCFALGVAVLGNTDCIQLLIVLLYCPMTVYSYWYCHKQSSLAHSCLPLTDRLCCQQLLCVVIVIFHIPLLFGFKQFANMHWNDVIPQAWFYFFYIFQGHLHLSPTHFCPLIPPSLSLSFL